jgi:hypothetical protein
MNARKMIKALSLALALAAVGCTQRTIIEERAPQDDSSSEPSPADDNSTDIPIAGRVLYVRSGDVKPGEEQSGPFPEPWQERMGPFPEPWHRAGADDGKSPPPPPSDPSPDPHPKP